MKANFCSDMKRVFFPRFTFISNFLSRFVTRCAIKIHFLSRRAYTHTFKLALYVLHGDVTSRTMFSLGRHAERRCNAYCVLQCVAVCCSVLQCVAVCCSVMQCDAVCCSVRQCITVWCSVVQCVAVCCSLFQCIVVYVVVCCTAAAP